jgi:hypothetical protein
MAEFSAILKEKGIGWPKNLWAGTSITTQGTTSRIKHLLQVGDESTVRFLSVEPQRADISINDWLPQLDWVIQGGESGRSAWPFHLEWARALIEQCKEARVAYFLKQLGSAVFSGEQRLRFHDGHAGDWSEWPEEFRVREMPHRVVNALRQEPFPLFMDGENTPSARRRPFEVADGGSKARQAGLKEWEARRQKQRDQKRSEAALKAWATRKQNERKKKRSEAAKKAWKTRRGNHRNGAG